MQRKPNSERVLELKMVQDITDHKRTLTWHVWVGEMISRLGKFTQYITVNELS